MRRAEPLLILAALFLALAPATRAQSRLVDDVLVDLESTWPATVGKGYFPVWVELENQSSDRKNVRISCEANSWGTPERTVRKAVELEPNETREVELYLPAFVENGGYSGRSGAFGMTVRVDRDESYFGIAAGAGGWVPQVLHVLIFTDHKVEPGDVEKLSERVKTEDLHGGVQRIISPGRSTATNVAAAILKPTRFPSYYQAYTSLDVVVVDAHDGLPDREDLAPIFKWVRLGGQAVFLGDDVEDELREIEDTGGAFEDRFAEGANGTYRFGHGRIYLGGGSDGLIQGSDTVDVVRRALAHSTSDEDGSSWVPHEGAWRMSGYRIEIPGLGELPLRVFMLLLLLFAVVIGPINLIVLKRLGRPALLLVSIPAISLIASLLLLAYGILYQGVDIKTASDTLTVLDQRTRSASTVERRTMFVGLSPGAGLRPGRDTTVFPERLEDESERYAIDFSAGILLRGTYLPVRDPVEQVLLSDVSGLEGRNRLTLSRENGSLVASNTFPVTIGGLLVADAVGELHGMVAPLDPGEKTELTRVTGQATLEVPDSLTGGLLMFRDQELTKSTYAAILEESPFTDACGLELNELRGRHMVFGILPELEKDW